MSYIYSSPAAVTLHPRVSIASESIYQSNILSTRSNINVGTEALCQLQREVRNMREIIENQENLLRTIFSDADKLKSALLGLELGALNKTHSDIREAWPQDGELLTFEARVSAIQSLCVYGAPLAIACLELVNDYRGGQLTAFESIAGTVETLQTPSSRNNLELNMYKRQPASQQLTNAVTDSMLQHDELNKHIESYRLKAQAALEAGKSWNTAPTNVD